MSASVEVPTDEPAAAVELARAVTSSGEGSTTADIHGLGKWIDNFRNYEITLCEVTATSADLKFKAELSTLEQWYKVLPKTERTASVYNLLQLADQDQIRFYISVLQHMIRPEVPIPEAKASESTQPVPAKQGLRSARPPSLNLPLLGSPTTPTATPATAMDPSSALEQLQSMNRLAGLRQSAESNSKDTDKSSGRNVASLPGLGMLSPYHLNMIANAGLSPEAQLLAVQLVMSGLVQPAGAPAQAQKATQSQGKKSSPSEMKPWRTPTSAKYPTSALRTGGLRAAATLKNASLKSAGLQSAGLLSAGVLGSAKKSSGLDSGISSMATPREEDFEPEMLNDIPAWLRSLRLHKYTTCFDGLTWQEIIVLDDATLEAKGVAALGARRRLLRTFEHARKKMGMESSDVTPTRDPINRSQLSVSDLTVPHSAAPTSTSKLSITSPVFVPSFERVPHSAAATVSFAPPATSGATAGATV